MKKSKLPKNVEVKKRARRSLRKISKKDRKLEKEVDEINSLIFSNRGDLRDSKYLQQLNIKKVDKGNPLRKGYGLSSEEKLVRVRPKNHKEYRLMYSFKETDLFGVEKIILQDVRKRDEGTYKRS